MIRAARNFARDARGSAMVEFALAAVPLLTAVFGTIEFARYAWALNVAEQVAADTARCTAMLRDGCTSGGAASAANARDFAVAYAAGRALVITAAEVAVDPTAACGGLPGFTRVQVTTRFNAATPLVGALLDRPIVAGACFPNRT